MKSKKTWLFASALGILTLLFAGCGRNLTGTYAFQQTFAGTQMCGAPTAQVNFQMYQNGAAITGTAQGQCFTEQFTGTDAGNMINSVSVSVTPFGSQTPCVFTGMLQAYNGQIGGTLSPQAQSGQQGQQGQVNGACGYSLTIQGTTNR